MPAVNCIYFINVNHRNEYPIEVIQSGVFYAIDVMKMPENLEIVGFLALCHKLYELILFGFLHRI